MTYVTAQQLGAWPALPDDTDGAQILAIARMVERVCGTEAAANYLSEAITAFGRKARIVEASVTSHESDLRNGRTELAQQG